MSEVNGVLQQVKSKQTSTGKTAFDIQVSGQWYGFGFFAPKAKEGDYVTFTSVANGNFNNVERGSLKVSGYKPSKDEVASAKQNVKAAANSYDTRQDAISRQAASNTAIDWLRFLHETGALASTTKSKGAQQAAMDTLREEYEKTFYERNTGNAWKDISPNTKQGPEDMSISEDSPEDEAWE